MQPGTSSAAGALDSATRELTRILVVFSLTGRLRPEGAALGSMVDALDFGRFALHLRSSEKVLPVPVLTEPVAPGDLRLPHGDTGMELTSAEFTVVATPRGDVTLVLDCAFTGETAADRLAAWLAATCFDRERIRIGDRPLLDVLNERLAPPDPLAFGQNVHQLVFPGGQLRDDVLRADAVRLPLLLNEILYRGRMGAPLASQPAVPPNLRNHGTTLSAHGRGVSVHAGWAQHVENGLALVAVGMISALAVLQRTRLAAFETMRANEQAQGHSPTEIRSLISRLSTGVNELQLDLAFGVEAYVDSLLIPEMVMEAFQSSLRDALGIRDTNLWRLQELAAEHLIAMRS